MKYLSYFVDDSYTFRGARTRGGYRSIQVEHTKGVLYCLYNTRRAFVSCVGITKGYNIVHSTRDCAESYKSTKSNSIRFASFVQGA